MGETALKFNQSSGPEVLLVPEMAGDEECRVKAERLFRTTGHLALVRDVEVNPVEPEATKLRRYGSLMEAIHCAADGDPEATKLIGANTGSDVIERTLKSGHVRKTEISLDKNNRPLQHGQTLIDVNKNALRFASNRWQMRERSKAETRNSFRIEYRNRRGQLSDNYLVVWSCCADNMTDDELTECGFFTDTKSCAIQATTACGQGLVTESAFVAGVKEPDAPRHDIETVKAVAALLGIDYSGKTAAQIIDTPMLIPKSLMPNGVIDLVKLYDMCAVGTFFGEDKPVQDYLEYAKLCEQREESYEPNVRAIVEQLISEAPQIKTPLEAIQRLHQLSQDSMVERSLHDTSINLRVFGNIAAHHIEQARYFLAQGDNEAASKAMQAAQETAVSSSCPIDTSTEEEKSGIKKMTCPYCGDKNQYGDPCSSNQFCSSCRATVIGGKVAYKGNGGRKKALYNKPSSNKVVGTSAKQHISAENLRFGAHVPSSTLRSNARFSTKLHYFAKVPVVSIEEARKNRSSKVGHEFEKQPV